MKTYPAPANIDRIELTSDEVTVMCPVTGNPDFYTVEIDYDPANVVLCTKALKEWFTGQRETGYSCETFAQKVYETVEAAVTPKYLCVTVTQKPRGGIAIVAEARDATSWH